MPYQQLSPREREVARLAALGKTTGEIAALLGTSRHTVRFQLVAVYQKWRLRDRHGLTRRALSEGLITLYDLDGGTKP